MCLFLGDDERKLNIRRRHGRETIFFSGNANFLITDEQELIFSLSDSHEPPAFTSTHLLFGFRFELSGNYVRPLIYRLYDTHEKFNFLKIQDIRPLNTCQEHF